jgi:hypothetical protein
MTTDPLWTVYENTILRFAGTSRFAVDLARPLSAAARATLAAIGIGTPFAVITAYNPGGRDLPAIRNYWRHLRLRVSLATRRTPLVTVSGESADGSHRERGFAAAMSRADAAAIARRFGQLAIYWFDGESFWLDPVLAERAPERLPA